MVALVPCILHRDLDALSSGQEHLMAAEHSVGSDLGSEMSGEEQKGSDAGSTDSRQVLTGGLLRAKG